MSIDHLGLLYREIPELFQPRDLSPDWDEGFIIVPIDDLESVVGSNGADINLAEPIDNESEIVEKIIFESEETTAPPTMPEMPGFIIDVMGGAHSGSPLANQSGFPAPPPDSLAFYLPFHYYHPIWWGIYILADGVQWLAKDIVGRSHGKVSLIDAILAARLYLFYHESFHHKTECLATRLELTHRKPCYKTGFERYFQNTFLTDKCLEEGLADAFALKHTFSILKDRDIDEALCSHVLDTPPGYRMGVEIRRRWEEVRSEFAEANQHFCFPHLPAKNPNVWRTAPHMFDGIANIKARVNYVIPRNSSIAKRMPFRAKLSPEKLVKKLQKMIDLSFVRHGGNHDVYRTPDGSNVAIPRHARDVGSGLLRSILREAGLHIGIDEFMRS